MKITIEVEDEKAIAIVKELLDRLSFKTEITRELAEIDEVEKELEDTVDRVEHDIDAIKAEVKGDVR